MLCLNILLVLPIMTALAMPVDTVTEFSEVIKRGDAIVGPPVQPVPHKSSPPVAVLETELLKRAEAVYAPEQTVIHSTSSSAPFLAHPPTTTVPLVPTSTSEPILSREVSLHARVEEPKLPEFIDTGACLCGLLTSQSTLPSNGEINEMWRCTADAAPAIITQGGNGKWYNTTLPSTDVSGVGEPRNWGSNPPSVSQTYVLVFANGGAFYAPLNAVDVGALHGDDYKCTGVNDTSASGRFYAGQ